MKVNGHVTLTVLACVWLFGLPAYGAAQPDEVFYFHDAGDGVWNNDWHSGETQCFGETGEWMDAEHPTGAGAEHYLMPQQTRCHLHLPGCLEGTIPFGTWYMNLYLKGTPAKLDGYLYAEDCDLLCSNTRFVVHFDGAFTGSPDYTLVKTPAKADSLVLSGERLLLEIVAIPPNAVQMLWDDDEMPSNLTAPGPVAVEPSPWGRIKSLFKN
jgi:hypothetical protein